MGWGEGAGVGGDIESEVRLIYSDTSLKMPPRQIPAGQGRLTFGVAPGSAAADTAGATVDEDDEDFKAVLVAEQQKQQKERTQPVLCTEDRPKDVGIGKASCVFKGTVKMKGKMVAGYHVVHCFEPAVVTHGMDALVNTLRKVRSFLASCKVCSKILTGTGQVRLLPHFQNKKGKGGDITCKQLHTLTEEQK